MARIDLGLVKGKDGLNVNVNGISPDANGNIVLEAGDVGAIAKTGGTVNGILRIETEGPAARFVGTTHSYVEFYRNGISGGRSANIGFSGTGKDLYITNAVEGGAIRLSASGNVTVGNQNIIHTGNKNLIAPSDIGAAPAPTISQTDITAGSTALANGKSYHVYE